MGDRKQPNPLPPGTVRPQPPPAPPKPANLKQAMSGATQDFKANLRKTVDESTYRDISRVALRILESLPKDAPLGTITAGLMFAATAYAEGASHAARLIVGKETPWP